MVANILSLHLNFTWVGHVDVTKTVASPFQHFLHLGMYGCYGAGGEVFLHGRGAWGHDSVVILALLVILAVVRGTKVVANLMGQDVHHHCQVAVHLGPGHIALLEIQYLKTSTLLTFNPH